MPSLSQRNCQHLVSHSVEAFAEYRSDSIELSCSEVTMISAIEKGQVEEVMNLSKTLGWISADGKLKVNRERQETEEKLCRLGLEIPWRT